MTWFAYTAAVLALLVTPGPTNTLLFVAGTERGWRKALALIPFELSAYLIVVLPLSILARRGLTDLPVAAPAISVAAGIWVGVLALGLWREPGGAQAPRAVTATGVFTTTLLNPKALVFGLVLVPAAADQTAAVALFAAMVGGVAAAWAATGAIAAGSPSAASRRVVWVRRASALWLAALAVGLVVRGVAA